MSNEVIPAEQPAEQSTSTALIANVEAEKQAWELAQRKAQIYARSSLVPEAYRGNIGNVLIAQNMAKRMGADVLMVMQNLHVIHGRPSWSSAFLISCFNLCGEYTAIRYKFSGKPGMSDYGCMAYCTEKKSGDLIVGPRVTMAMAKAEGWLTKKGSKWQTMPDLMLTYRAATFLIRTTAPQIAMGLHTADELEDVYTVDAPSRPVELRKGSSGVLDALRARHNAEPEVVGIDDLPAEEPPAEEFVEEAEFERSEDAEE